MLTSPLRAYRVWGSASTALVCHSGSARRRRHGVSSGRLSASPDDLDPILIRVAHEAEARAALAHRVRRPLRLDPLSLERVERPVEVVDADRDVAVAAAEVVRAPVVVERQLEDVLAVRQAEEVVGGLLLAVSDDVHLAAEREPERLVERPALLRVGDPDHRVEIACHGGHSRVGHRAATPYQSARMLSSAEPASTAVVKAESSSGAIAKACSGVGKVRPRTSSA